MNNITRKYCRLLSGLLLLAGLLHSNLINCQTEETNSWKTGADFYSSFIWRGSKLGSGPAVQPVVEFTTGPFTAGAWGSFDFRDFQEVDLYLSFALPVGFNLGITDYYSPNLKYFDYTNLSGSHAFEANLEYSHGNLNFAANYIFNEAGGIGSLGNDIYFQAGYSFRNFSLFAGAGNGWHTYETGDLSNDFKVCNIGLETSSTIVITDRFSIPLTGKIVFNPDKEQLFIVVGFTL